MDDVLLTADNCGSSHNVTYYSELFNQTGKAIRIEDCHTSPAHPDVLADGSISCPMNMYRAGGDIKPSFGSIIGEIYSTITWNDRKRPLSFPGCWACVPPTQASDSYCRSD
eukprot:COSAG01_NODE_6858_length_3467_cov_3.421021_4_plen_111_part_00